MKSDHVHDTLVVRRAGSSRLTLREHGPQQVLYSAWENRRVLRQLSMQEIAARYRGSFLGFAWSLLTPLLMLAVYTFVFSEIFQARWEVGVGNKAEFALILFSGLILFQFFSECITRAPSLMFENVSYIKRIVFPIEVLPWVALAGALFNALIGFAVLIIASSLITAPPSATVLWLPLVLLPLILITLGGMWLLASIGVYIRDVRQAIAVLIPMLMFATPIFYPASAVPESFRWAIYINPLTFIVEQTRDVVLFGRAPDVTGLALFSLAALAVAWFGLLWFNLTKRGFADVV